jgi:hypothetical protein
MKLKLSEWANIAEIIAAGVIVASVIYLSYEINQNTRALQTDSYQNVLNEIGGLNIAVATDEEFHRIFRLGEQSPSELSELDWARFTQITFSYSGLWEYLYLGRQENSITPAVWSAFDPYFRGIVCMPGYRRFYAEQRHAHAPEFITYVETDAMRACLPE